jgi:hypothetical protein
MFTTVQDSQKYDYKASLSRTPPEFPLHISELPLCFPFQEQSTFGSAAKKA